MSLLENKRYGYIERKKQNSVPTNTIKTFPWKVYIYVHTYVYII